MALHKACLDSLGQVYQHHDPIDPEEEEGRTAVGTEDVVVGIEKDQVGLEAVGVVDLGEQYELELELELELAQDGNHSG